MLFIHRERSIVLPLVVAAVSLAVCSIALSGSAAAQTIDRVRLEAAKKELERKREARISAGWVAPSDEEKMLTKLRASRGRHEYRQHLAATRSVLEAARAEAYREVVGDFLENAVTTVDSGFRTSLIEDPNTGELMPLVTRDQQQVADPLMVAFAAHFAEKGARSAGIAAAQNYRANTFYASRIENVDRRIRDLEARITAGKGGRFAKLP